LPRMSRQRRSRTPAGFVAALVAVLVETMINRLVWFGAS